jgi:nucleotide-binding universal stress UspA family protein
VFGRILVPLDGSPQAGVALPLARTILGRTPAELVLVRVVANPTSMPVESSDEAFEAKTYLNWVATELRDRPTSVETHVLFGDPGHEIVNATRILGVDLAVMATHGRNDLERLRFGSVAEYVIGYSPVPVLVVRPGGRRITRIRTLLVPLDGSPASRRALAAATLLARQHSARIELITAIRGVPGNLKQPLPGLDLGPYLAPSWASARQEAEDALQLLAERLCRHGINAGARAAVGDARHVIVNAAEQTDADLVVMSTHALVGPARSLLASVAASVIHDAGRPVLLVHRAARPRSNRRPRTPHQYAAGNEPGITEGGMNT